MKRTMLLIAILLVFSVSAFAQNNLEPPLITVTGQAEVRVPPDEVLFTLVVENIDRDMTLASKHTDDSVKQILSIARKNNIKAEDVQTSQISVEPKYNTDDMEYSERSRVKRVLIGYRVSKTIGIRLREISRLDEVLADVFKSGITSLSNLRFNNSQIRKHRDEARRMAIRAAKEKAALLAGEIGQSIGPAYSITEETPQVYSNINQNNVSLSREGSSDQESDTAIAPGTISVTAQVTVRFRLQ